MGMRVRLLPQSPGLVHGFVRTAVRIRYAGLWPRTETLWFDVPEACAPDLGPGGEGWLVALISQAFHRQEPLELDAPVDPLLVDHLAEVQRIWSKWYPGLVPVPIRTQPQRSCAQPSKARVGLFFTAGVDWLFTLLHSEAAARSRERAGAQAVDDLIYVCGYDIPLANQAAWQRKLRTLAEVASRLGKSFVPMLTNLRQTRLRKLDWGHILFGPAVIAAGLLLGNRFSRLLLSSGPKHEEGFAWGSHPQVDPLFATSRTAVIRYSAECDPVEKMAFLVQSNFALQYLHVCWIKGTDLNCGVCEKCLRTRLMLELLGASAQAMTFPSVPFGPEDISRLELQTPGQAEYFRELLPHAQRLGRLDYAKAIETCLARYQATQAHPGQDCRTVNRHRL